MTGSRSRRRWWWSALWWGASGLVLRSLTLLRRRRQRCPRHRARDDGIAARGGARFLLGLSSGFGALALPCSAELRLARQGARAVALAHDLVGDRDRLGSPSLGPPHFGAIWAIDSDLDRLSLLSAGVLGVGHTPLRVRAFVELIGFGHRRGSHQRCRKQDNPHRWFLSRFLMRRLRRLRKGPGSRSAGAAAVGARPRSGGPCTGSTAPPGARGRSG